MILLFESKLDKQKFIDYIEENVRHGEWIVNDFFTLKPKMEPPYNDVYYWMKRPINELIDYLSKVKYKKSQAELRASAKGGARLLADENGWKVLEIFTQPASAYYGRNTKWCISSTDGNERLYWDLNITKRNARLFFFIHGNDEKYAVVLSPRGYAEVWNQEDVNLTSHGKGLPDGCPVIDELADTNAYKD